MAKNELGRDTMGTEIKEGEDEWLQLRMSSSNFHEKGASKGEMRIDSEAGQCSMNLKKDKSSLALQPGSGSFYPNLFNWTYRSSISFISYPSSSSSSFPSTFHVPFPTTEFRIIDPQTAARSCVWFVLQASQNQYVVSVTLTQVICLIEICRRKEPFLPQITKSYLRIKDGSMTIRLLLKYLVHKLNLDNELEVEVSCRGRDLLPVLTLKQVRDCIWFREDAMKSFNPNSTNEHLMVLTYGRKL